MTNRTACILVVLSLVCSCAVVNDTRQVLTVGYLLDVCSVLEQLAKEKQRLPTQEELWAAVPTTRHQDAWGNEFQYVFEGLGSGSQYLLVSLGADREWDVVTPTDYVGQKFRDVSGRAKADLVIVDGEFVQGIRK